jgi:hypothetical protein
MFYKVVDWQTGAESSPSGGQFFTVCPIYYMWNDPMNGLSESTADWVIAWSLKDSNNNVISNDLVIALFGVGTSTTPLSLTDQNNPLAAAGYGWYCDIATPAGAVTTPFDAFMNWGEGVPSYSPQVLAAQLFDGTLYEANNGFYGAQFAAAAAADTPPPALVTLPDSISFRLSGDAPVSGQVNLTNNQQNDLQKITFKTSGSTAFSVSGIPTELASGYTAPITVQFDPDVFDTELNGAVIISAQGHYDQITLTLEFSGIASS